ncbi:hypothetical protein WDZ17_12870 [Pseudokineococcus basanitobsidens]|uniref:Aldehyde dehydrogenase family protein n=1 Tax=Pseudokineococcus basanitobsidens TaxID=1926649 RepID=A0ABU8RMB0_9ACTN
MSVPTAEDLERARARTAEWETPPLTLELRRVVERHLVPALREARRSR